MANQCPICSKHFTSKITLRNHTGTNDAALRRAHICHKCERGFCSQKAMEQHLDAPSHSVAPSQNAASSQVTIFRCEVCKKSFGSKQAMGQHEKSGSHAKMRARANVMVGGGMSLDPGNASSYQAQSRILGVTSTAIDEETPSDTDSEEEYSDEGAWAQENPRSIWDDDQDWALCDTDCGWCGHCADGVDY